MTAEVRTVETGELKRYAEGIRDVYARAFAAPPWNEDPAEADSYAERLARDALRPGFTAAVATADGAVTGFATAWRSFRPTAATGRSPRPSGRNGPGRGSAVRWR